MDPGIIALICAASFGAVVALAAFIHQMVLSRDKRLNDEAQHRAIKQEAAELNKLREQMLNNKRFDAHYKALGNNKDAIFYLDRKIEDLFKKKTELILRYSELALRESGSMIDGKISKERKEACEQLKASMDDAMKVHAAELEKIQQHRNTLWDGHKDLQDSLLKQEQTRNANLDKIYEQHANLLVKIFLRHNDNAEHVATQSIHAGTATFKSIILAPLHFLLQYFNISSGITITQAQVEQAARDDVDKIERDINSSDTQDDDLEENKKDEKENNKDNSPDKLDDDEKEENSHAGISFANA